MPTIDEVIKNYIEKRDRKAEMAKRHAEEAAPLNNAMEIIENFLMNTMNQLGVDQLKAAGVGTAFKAVSTSCQMQDATAFKNFVFAPVVTGCVNYLAASGYTMQPHDIEKLSQIVREMAMWDMIDFRAGKKGIIEYINNEQAAVPGIAVNSVATINIRRA